MVLVSQQFFHPPLLASSRRRSCRVVRPCISCCSTAMDPQNKRPGFMEFPYLSPSNRNLMVDLVSTMETHFGSQLLPSSLPQDVEYFQNENGSSQGTLHIRTGDKDSLVNFILGSWIHSKLPKGYLNITTLTAYLNTKTDAPRFLLEFIQSSPTSLILILDLPPRKDLIIHPNYLNTYYIDTQLDKLRNQLNTLPEIRPYLSSSLYIRCALSPIAISVLIDVGTTGSGGMDDILTYHVGPVAKEILGIWLDKCGQGGKVLVDKERTELKLRDTLVNNKTLDVDLASGLPRLFGDDVANRVIQGIKRYFQE